MKEMQEFEQAAQAHTNLNIFASIVGILESGCVYPLGTASGSAQKIVSICAKEQSRQLRIYDEAAARLAQKIQETLNAK